MIEGISHNAILASVFGNNVIGRPQGTEYGSAQRADGFESHGETDAYPQPVDSVELSESHAHDKQRANVDRPERSGSSTDHSTHSSEKSGGGQLGPDASQLTEEEQKAVEKLKQRDQEVRRHEQAHKSAAGGFAKGGASFEFETGPDGRRYAVGGEVSIDTSEVSGNPRATIAKMQQIRRAALAPANPSGQDRAVAAQASAAEQKARTELAEQRKTNPTGGSEGDTTEGVETVSSSVNPIGEESDRRQIAANASQPFSAIPSINSADPAGSLVDLIA